MASEILIELNDDELLAVSGGGTAGIVQNIKARYLQVDAYPE